MEQLGYYYIFHVYLKQKRKEKNVNYNCLLRYMCTFNYYKFYNERPHM